MNIPSKIKILLYGITVFAIFIIIITIVKLFAPSHQPADELIFELFAKNDFLMGLVVAIVVTFTHERRKRL